MSDEPRSLIDSAFFVRRHQRPAFALPPEEFAKVIKTELPKWQKTVKDSEAQVE